MVSEIKLLVSKTPAQEENNSHFQYLFKITNSNILPLPWPLLYLLLFNEFYNSITSNINPLLFRSECDLITLFTYNMKIALIIACLFLTKGLFAGLIVSNSFEDPFDIPEVVFGNPEISSQSIGSGNTLEFEGRLSYEQIRVPLNSSNDKLFLSYNILAENILDSYYTFSVILDTPEVRTLSMHGGLNSFSVFQPSGLGGIILSAQDNVNYYFEHFIDFSENLWEISIDGESRFSAPINASNISSIRFSMSPWTLAENSDSPETIVLLDNLMISTTSVPEMSTMYTSLFFIATVLLFSRLKKKQCESGSRSE